LYGYVLRKNEDRIQKKGVNMKLKAKDPRGRPRSR
jgi:hypothetical protein